MKIRTYLFRLIAGVVFLLSSLTAEAIVITVDGYQDGFDNIAYLGFDNGSTVAPGIYAQKIEYDSGDEIPLQGVGFWHIETLGTSHLYQVMVRLGSNESHRTITGTYKITTNISTTEWLQVTMLPNQYYIYSVDIHNPNRIIGNGVDPGEITGETAVAYDNATVFYEWYRNEESRDAWDKIDGKKGLNYSPGPLYETTSYKRIAYLWDKDRSETSSNILTITVAFAKLVGGTISESQRIGINTAPRPLTLTGVTGGNRKYTYQWQEAKSNSWADIPGVTGTDYSPGVLNETTRYRVKVDTYGQTAYSTECVIEVLPDPALLAGAVTPARQEIYNKAQAQTLALGGVSGGNGQYTYQWQERIEQTDWFDIENATATHFTPLPQNHTRYYRVRVRSNGQEAYSEEAEVYIIDPSEDPLTPGTVSSPKTFYYGGGVPDTLKLSGTTGGVYLFAYQWQYSYDNSSWYDIKGATTQSFFPEPYSGKRTFGSKWSAGNKRLIRPP